MRKVHDWMPAIALPETPRAGRDAKRFAEEVRAYAQTLRVDGIVLVTTHWNRSNDSPSVIVEVDRERHETDSISVSERIASLLQRAGLSTEFGRPWPRENAAWDALLEAHENAPFPVTHVSVPARFGSDLMTLTAKALEPLRRESILLVGLSSAFGQGLRRERDNDRPAFLGLRPTNPMEGVPI